MYNFITRDNRTYYVFNGVEVGYYRFNLVESRYKAVLTAHFRESGLLNSPVDAQQWLKAAFDEVKDFIN